MKALTPELRKFVEKEELMRLGYTDGAGYPRVVPLWYVLLDNVYYVGTGANSAKRKAIQRDNRVGWVIDGGENRKYRGVSMCGTAEEVRDRELRARIYRDLGMKYFRDPAAPKFVEIYGQVDDADTVYFALMSEDGFSWSY